MGIQIRNPVPNNNPNKMHKKTKVVSIGTHEGKVSNFTKHNLEEKVFMVGETMFTRALF
jgi:hypothetical protein